MALENDCPRSRDTATRIFVVFELMTSHVVDVILVAAAGDVVDRYPLLVLDVTRAVRRHKMGRAAAS
jgi:hypothetical protein